MNTNNIVAGDRLQHQTRTKLETMDRSYDIEHQDTLIVPGSRVHSKTTAR